MAETQPEVERIKLDRVLIAEIAEQEHEIHLIQQKIRKLYRDRAAKLQEFDHQNVMDGGENSTENVRSRVKLIRSAPSTDAKGSRQYGNADCAATGPARVL
jgi:gamma-glutamyltranspeptidase